VFIERMKFYESDLKIFLKKIDSELLIASFAFKIRGIEQK